MLVAVIMCDPLCNTQAQDWAKERLNKSPRHGEWVDLKSGERTIKAFVVYPERKEKIDTQISYETQATCKEGGVVVATGLWPVFL